MLDALPDSCIYLELDTWGKDYRRKIEVVHVCDGIRRVLPRLQHVRIRLGAMPKYVPQRSATVKFRFTVWRIRLTWTREDFHVSLPAETQVSCDKLWNVYRGSDAALP
jgi:hypothetical protein